LAELGAFHLRAVWETVTLCFGRVVSTLAKGMVNWFDDKKGSASSRRKMVGGLFVHYSSINMPGFKSLAEGDRISFEVERPNVALRL
jgi:CspA family cold shock protein